MEQGIFYIAVGVAIILGTLVGRYVFPNISETVSSALNLLSAYPMLMMGHCRLPIHKAIFR